MLTRSDVESAAGSRSGVSGVSGKAFTIVLEVRTGSPQTKTAYDSTAKDEGRVNFFDENTSLSDAAARSPGHTEESRGDIRRVRPPRS